MTGRNTKKNMAVWLLAFLAATVLLWWRLPYGFGWNSETSWYAAAMRLCLGDMPFVDMWEGHQTFSILLSGPVGWYMDSHGGSTEGMLLFFRQAFLVFSLLLSVWSGYSLYAFSHNSLTSLMGALLLYLGVPLSLGAFTPTSTGLLFMTAAGCTMLRLYRPSSRRSMAGLSLIGGGLCALGIIVFPLFFLTVPCFFMMMVLCIPHKKKHRRAAALLPFSFGLLLGLGLYGGALLNRIGWDNLQNNLEWVFTSRSNPVSGWGKALVSFIRVYIKADPFYLLPLSLFILWALFRYVPLPLHFRPVKWFNRMIKICMPVCVLGSLLLTLNLPENDLSAALKLNRLQLCAGFWPLLLFLRRRRQKQFGAMFLCLYLPAQMMALAAYLSDRGSDFAASVMLLPGVICLSMMGCRLYMIHGRRDKGLTARKAYGICITSLAVCVLVANAGVRFLSNYDDEPVTRLSTVLTKGPAAGLITTAEQAQDYDVVLWELDQYLQETEKDEYLLLTGKLPLGYLYAGKRPAVPFVSGSGLDSAFLSEYLWSHKERMVPHIFQLREGYGRGNDEEDPDLQLAAWVFDAPVALTATNCSYQYRAVMEEMREPALEPAFEDAGIGLAWGPQA